MERTAFFLAIRKADVANWRRRYEAALTGTTFLSAAGEETSAWRFGYRDGRVLRFKLHREAQQLDSRRVDKSNVQSSKVALAVGQGSTLHTGGLTSYYYIII
jgi:hypothetical protein